MALDIDLLKTFLELNRTRHFGKASQNLFVTQSTVSARIRLLENTIGSSLFTRTRNDIQLTPAGRRLLKHAEQIVTTWNRARQEIAIEEENRIPLTISGVLSLWDIFLQDWLNFVSSNREEILLNIEFFSTDSMIRFLRDGTLDLAFMFDPPQYTDLIITEIARIPLIMVSSKAGETTMTAVRDNYILVDWGSSFSGAHARYFPDMPTPFMRTGLGKVAREFLLSCGGVAYLAEPMVLDALLAGRLHRVTDAPVIERSAFAIYSAENEKLPLLTKTLEFFHEITPAGSDEPENP